MAALETRTFTSGNSVALRLPRSLGIGPNIAMRIERRGDVLTVEPIVDPTEEKRRLLHLLADLQAIGQPADGVQKRESIEFPDRAEL